MPGPRTTPPVLVRLLGGLEVVRRDGTVVPPAAWRTGKTMDLFRMLALADGRPVRARALTDALWSTASPEHAGGSLRTAASQIRRAVEADCVVRHPEGLVLEGTWVDVAVYRDHARHARLALLDDRLVDVLDHTRRAETLWAGDLSAHDETAAWARAERSALRGLRSVMLADAAEAALRTGALREAVDLAQRAIAVDPGAEAVHRTLMTAYAELGETAAALRTFEGYRRQLAEELGADPSPQTRELHLRLLRGAGAD